MNLFDSVKRELEEWCKDEWKKGNRVKASKIKKVYEAMRYRYYLYSRKSERS